MQDCKKRWIELRNPHQRADGTWTCGYVLFEFGSTQWRYKPGFPDGGFASPEEAVAAALLEAKRIDSSLGLPSLPRKHSSKFRRRIPASLKQVVGG